MTLDFLILDFFVFWWFFVHKEGVVSTEGGVFGYVERAVARVRC